MGSGFCFSVRRGREGESRSGSRKEEEGEEEGEKKAKQNIFFERKNSAVFFFFWLERREQGKEKSSSESRTPLRIGSSLSLLGHAVNLHGVAWAVVAFRSSGRAFQRGRAQERENGMRPSSPSSSFVVGALLFSIMPFFAWLFAASFLPRPGLYLAFHHSQEQHRYPRQLAKQTTGRFC